jgi:predicted transcriptional regulator
MAVGGASKSFKTWTLLDLAISVSTGADWLQFHTTKGKVLFINFEIQNYSWQQRLNKVAESKGVELNDNLILCNLRGHAEDFRTLIPKIIQQCARENYSLIILDPIYKIYGNTDENSAKDTAQLLNSLEQLANETGAAVAFAAHFAKGNSAGKNAIDRISGSGVFARDPDSILVFTEHESESAFTIEPILRNFPRVPSFSVRWQFPLMVPAAELDPSKLRQPGRKKEVEPTNILPLMVQFDELNPVSVSELARLSKIKRPTLINYLSELRAKGFVKTVGEGNKAKQIITNDGKEFVKKREQNNALSQIIPDS